MSLFRKAEAPLGAGDGVRSGGFTLLELALVVMLVGVLAAITMPQFLPVIAYSELEGAARHLASYGRAAMAECALSHENLTIHVKLDSKEDAPQEYWCVKWPDLMEQFGLSKDEDDEDQKKKEEALKIFDEVMQNPNDPLLQEEAMKKLEKLGQNQDEIMALAVQERFDRMMRMALMAQSRNVKHDSIMDEFGPLFDKEFSLDDDKEKKEEEIKSELLLRTRVPNPGVEIESMVVGTKTHTRGDVEIDVSPMGMSDPVRFFLTNSDGDYITVVWDPISGNASVLDGKETGE